MGEGQEFRISGEIPISRVITLAKASSASYISVITSARTSGLLAEFIKSLSVNNMVHCLPSRLGRIGEINDGETCDAQQGGSMGSVGRVLATGRTLDPSAPACEGQALRAQTRGWAQTQGGAPGVRGHRLRVAHGLSVEGVADRALWERERHSQALSRVAE